MAATLGELKAALVNADKAGDADAARRLAAAVNHMQTNNLQLYEPPAKPMGFFEGVKEAITGDKRKTEETEKLADWTTMPEFNEVSWSAAKTGVGTMLTQPKETVAIIKENYPDVEIRQDRKGNYLIKSSVDGQEYAIKPGFRVSDLPRAVFALAAFTPAGRATSMAGMGAGAAATQAAIEASQAATGGEFNKKDVVVAGAVGAAVPAVVSAVQAAKAPAAAIIDNVLGRVTPASPAAPVAAAPAAAAPVIPPVVLPLRPAVVAAPAPELAQTAKTAAEGGLGSKGATKVLAEQAMPDAKTVEAAQRLGIEDYLQPDHVTTNQAYRELAQAVKSVPGSTTRAAENEGLINVGKRADDLITEIGGTTDVSQLSASVKARLQSTQADLEKEANKLYGQLRKDIPARAEVEAPSVLQFIEQRAGDLGGRQNLTSMEKMILTKLTPKEISRNKFIGKSPDDLPKLLSGGVQNPIPKATGSLNFYERGKYTVVDMPIGVLKSTQDDLNLNNLKIFDLKKVPPGDDSLPSVMVNKLGEYVVDDGNHRVALALLKGEPTVKVRLAKNLDGSLPPIPLRTSQPTYALLDDVRRDLTAAKYQRQGPFKDADTGLIKKLEMELKKDQRAAIEPYNMMDTFDAAQSAVRVRKGLEDDLVALFGKTLDGSIVGDLSGAVKSLPSGDVSKLVKLLKAIPEDMRQETMASGLTTAFGKQIQNGNLNFNTYQKWYEGLLRNKQAYTAVMANLPSGARKQLSDLYRVSKGINMATRERITTGRIQAVRDELQGADSLIGNLYHLAKRSSVGAAAELVTTPLGAPGAGMAAGIASALTKGKPNAMKAVDALISSPEFAAAIKQVANDPTGAATRLAYSKPFTKFVRAVGNPKELSNRERWIMQILEAQNQGQRN